MKFSFCLVLCFISLLFLGCETSKCCKDNSNNIISYNKAQQSIITIDEAKKALLHELSHKKHENLKDYKQYLKEALVEKSDKNDKYGVYIGPWYINTNHSSCVLLVATGFQKWIYTGIFKSTPVQNKLKIRS